MSNTTPPGWYPDQTGQQRYWDGTRWTEHTVPVTPSPQGFVPTGPQQPAEKNWFLRHPVWSAVIALVVIGAIGSAASGGTKSDDDVTGTAADAKPLAQIPAGDEPAAPAPQPKAKAKPKPKASLQGRFIDVVEDAIDKADDADNEIQVVQARKKRGTAMCSVLPRTLEVSGWTGKIHDVSTELGGDKGVVDVKLTDEINVATWNNSLSDIKDNTMIAPDSDLYGVLADLKDGDKVTFSGKFIKESGNCIGEQSLTDAGGMKTPTFSFRFTSIKKR